MIILAGFLEVILRSLVLVGQAAAAGGVLFCLAVLRPRDGLSPFSRASLRRSLLLVAGGALLLACAQALVLCVEPWALADELGRWPVAQFLLTTFGRASVVHALLALLVAALAAALLKRPTSRALWAVLVAATLAQAASGAWIVHAASRLVHATPLMVIQVLHQLGAALWIGGLFHLVTLRLLARRDPAGAADWPQLLARFSPVALSAVGMVVGAGVSMALFYVGSWRGLVGTAYGAMVLTKVALLGIALLLGGLNFLAIRSWWGRGDLSAIRERLPATLESEALVGVVILLAAAALTSQPPAVDILAQSATPGEVLRVFAPKIPQLNAPPYREMLARAASSFDPFAVPGLLDRMQSNFNHNISGLIVFLAGLAALLERTGRAPWGRHWPLLFFLLAGFLLLYAEPNGWPLGNESFWGTLVVPGVLQHRLATLLVAGLAAFEWRVRAGRLAGTRWRYAFPILCLVGGALLLTHSHTSFALKETFLIEVSHNALGLLAVITGVGRLLELRLPRGSALAGYLWTVGLTLTGVVLLFYREG